MRRYMELDVFSDRPLFGNPLAVVIDAEGLAVRAFCPADGIAEDPVAGSANAAIGAWLHASGTLRDYGQRYRASQGRGVGRDGVVEVSVSDTGAVSIGGVCTLLVEGTLRGV